MCEGEGRIELKVNEVIINNDAAREYVSNMNISYECQGEGTPSGACDTSNSSCVVNILPILNNNNTELRCVFNRGSTCFIQTQIAKLIIVEGTHSASRTWLP